MNYELTNRFLEYLRCERNRSALTVEAYSRDLDAFAQWLATPPEKATTAQIRSWLAEQATRGLAPRTLRRRAQALRSFFSWLVKTGQLAVSPAAMLTLPKTDRQLPQFVDAPHAQAILQSHLSEDPSLEIRNRLIIELLYTCGLRQAELRELTDGDISEDRSEMRIHGKGGKTRIIPLAPQTIESIHLWQQHRDATLSTRPSGPLPLFPGRGGNPLSKPRIYEIVHESLASAGVSRRSPHVLRHSFATAMLNGGADIATVREFLGHSSLSSTQIYTHLDFGRLRSDYSAAHPRAEKPPKNRE